MTLYKTKQVTVRLNLNEYRMFKKVARKMQVPVSTAIRQLVLASNCVEEEVRKDSNVSGQ